MEDIEGAKKDISKAFIEVYNASRYLDSVKNIDKEVKNNIMTYLDTIYNFLDSSAIELNLNLHEVMRDEGIEVEPFEE